MPPAAITRDSETQSETEGRTCGFLRPWQRCPSVSDVRHMYVDGRHRRYRNAWLSSSRRLYTLLAKKNLAPCGTDGRLLEWLSITRDLDLDFVSGHTAYGRASLIDLYLHTKFH